MTTTKKLDAGPELLTTEEAAEWLHITPAAMRAWRVRGGGPTYCKVGRGVRYDVVDLRAWLAAQRVAGSDA